MKPSPATPPARRPRVCILTTVHDPDDDRIFHKQALSLAKAGFDVALAGCWTDAIDSGPVRKLPLPEYRSRLGRLVGGSFSALRAAWRDRADVYHFHDPELIPVGVLLALAGRRVIYDVHEDYARKLRSRGLPALVGLVAASAVRLCERVAARFFTFIVTADSHVASLFPPHKTAVIANYPPLDFFPASSEPPARHHPLRLVYVGGISRTRGIPRILETLDRMPDDEVEFHLAGPIHDRALLDQVRRHPRVIFHGELPWREVAPLLGACDIGLLLLQPSPALNYHPGENLIKLWEYLGTGLPVILSDTPKLRRLIESLDAGLAVDPANPEAIIAAIRRLASDEPLRQRLGANGRRAVRADRNWEGEADKLAGIYTRLLAA